MSSRGDNKNEVDSEQPMSGSTVELATAHILRNLEEHRKGPSTKTTPLFVAIQGPQGSGKTFLTSQLCDILRSPPHSLSVATLSIDDLYLPHADLVALAKRHGENVLLQGRGQPGTHDVQLARTLLRDLLHINDSGSPGGRNSTRVLLPVYDKSLHNGAGDRTQNVVAVDPLVDVVILEGWCVGFFPLPSEEIEKRWAEQFRGNTSTIQRYRKEDILELNELLKEYVALWDFFTVFIQVRR